MPKKCTIKNFLKDFKTLLKTPFVIYADFECASLSSTDNGYHYLKTEKYQDHIVWNYGYKLICVDEKYSKTWKSYFG